MKLSIIIPTYNSAKTLPKALDSIVYQTFTDWEILIMDGASNDETINVAKNYNDPRIRIYSEQDNGIYDAMNKGIKKAKGDWLYFLGSDDRILTSTVFHEIFSLNITGYDIIYGEVISPILSDSNRGEWTLKNISANRCHQSIFYRKEVFKQIGYYNPRYPYAADFELNLRWFFNKNIRKKHIPIAIAYFSPGGASENNTDDNFWKDFYLLILKYGHSELHKSEKKYYVYNAFLQENNYLKKSTLRLILLYLDVSIIISRKTKQILYGHATC